MQSPFAIFRKHQRVALAAVTLMAMFAFVFMDTFSRGMNPSNTQAAELAVETKAGNLTRAELQNLTNQRRIANNFIEVAYFEAHPEFNNPQFAQFIEPQLRQIRFGFGRGTTNEDVLLGYLLRQEAHRLGVVISDEQIEGFIDQITDQKLTSAKFRDIVNRLHLSPKQLYTILREELAARAALRVAAPLNPQTPEQYWEFFKQLHVRQKLEAAAVPVVAFTGQVPAPAESELKAYFNEHKSKYETVEDGVLQPGFRQPRKVALQYAEASFEAARELVGKEKPVTDKDVEEYYEKNKETHYRIATIPSEEGSDALNPEFTPEKEAPEKEAPEGDKPADDKTPPAEPKPEEPAEGKDAPKSDAPKTDSPEKKADEKPEASPDGEKKDGEKKDGEKSDGEKKEAEKKDSEKTDADKKEAPASEKQSDPKPADEGKSQSAVSPTFLPATARSILTARATPGSQLALAGSEDKPTAEAASEQKDAEKKDAEEQPAAKTEDNAKSADKPADGEKKPESPAAEPADSEKKEAPKDKPADAEKPEGEKPAAEKPESDKPAPEKKEEESEEKPEGSKPESGDDKKTPPVKYRALDDELRQQIRDELIRERAAALLRDRVQDVFSKMQEAGLKYTTEYAMTNLDAEQRGKLAAAAESDLKALAKEYGMKYGETGLVSPFELSEIPGIGKAQEPSEDPLARGGAATLIDQVFSSGEQLCVPGRVEDPATNDLYVYWKVADIAPHVAKFDDPGIKEQVEKTWRRIKAQPLAQARAKALADSARKSGKSMQEVLGGQTITGDQDGVQITVHETPEFSWLREAPAPGFNPFSPRPPPRLSDPVFVDKPGTEFMQTVFDELNVNDIGVASNADKSVFYVVKVVSRTPADREEFLKAPLFGSDALRGFSMPTPYDQLAQQQQQMANYRFSVELEKKYKVKWHTETETELEAMGDGEV